MSKDATTATALLITREPHPDALRRALLDAGYQSIVIVATIDSAARWHRESRRLDVILFDLGSGDRDLVSEIPRIERHVRRVPIVAVVPEHALGAALDAGATEAVARPVRPVELVVRLDRVRRMFESESRKTGRQRKLSVTIDRRESANRDLEKLVCVDALTGIANRRHTLALLEAECKRARRDGTPLSVARSEIDGFHEYNERYGRSEGDSCLQRVVETMAQCLRRPSDLLGRYGSEQLVAVLPNTNAVGASIVCERMRAAVESLAIPHAASPCGSIVTVSVGFASLTRVDSTADLLLAAADTALLRARAAGRNRVGGEAGPIVQLRQSPERGDRLPALLATAREVAQHVALSARAGDLDDAVPLARKLKTAAIEYGLDHVRLLAGQLENAARAADAASIAVVAAGVVEYVDQVEVVYRRADESEERD